MGAVARKEGEIDDANQPLANYRTLRQAAGELNVTPQTLRDEARKGHLRTIKLDGLRLTRIDWIEEYRERYSRKG